MKGGNMKKESVLKKLARKAKNRFLSGGQSPVCEYKIVASHDEEFVDKVRQLVRMETKTNPIAELMEESVLKRLSESGREKYLLDTVDRYLKALEVIEKEKTDKD